ncbi:MAG: CoB--CoM heterodisulfide reductase iron-sulfur subunit A family protein [Methanospirillaceae archaeon]|nr:CoB--CoM heterodisulfide reductase iron-sulfur subunit A family protein [Methanospirillaceae archaeon]
MNDVVVVGAGIAGITAALDIANHGIFVHLIEREPSIGGHMAMLDKTFPTNDCSMCILSPKMVDVSRHERITVYTTTEVTSITGSAGNFTVIAQRHPRYIDMERCTGCGDCIDVCPVEVYNMFDAGLGVRKAIYKPHKQVVPDCVVRDIKHCIDCGLCYDICGTGAVLHDDEDQVEILEIPATAVVITTGYDLYDAGEKKRYGYLRIPDVITSIEFERMINASGPTGGELRRLSDGNIPESIVFIQCVGSRDMTESGNAYCSCVCCMYAIKNAILIKEKYPDTEVIILYMDIRAYGKGYEEYYQRAVTIGIRFIRALAGDLYEVDHSICIRIEDTETGDMEILKPQLVILSVAIQPTSDAGEIAKRFGIASDDYGFFLSLHEKTGIVQTSVPGIFIAGTCRAPKDIPDTVAEGGAAAMQAVIETLQAGH